MAANRKALSFSTGLCAASILIYTLWLLLPAVQTTGRAYTGALAVGVFALGVVLDTSYMKENKFWMLARAACALLVPLILWQYAGRGGENFAGYLVQQSMFWFPLIYCAYARERGDARLWRWLMPVLLGAAALTTLTTIGWLIEGMLRGGRVYAYSRSLGFAGQGREAYLKELMLRNIGGYDFIYASVISLPLTCAAIGAWKGWRRVGMTGFLALQLIMIALSQYTYAMIFAAALMVVEGTALLIRVLAHGRVKLGASLLWGLVPIVLLALLLQPLAALGASICRNLGFESFAFSLEQLLIALRGGLTDDAARLGHYQTALAGLRNSPLIGALLGGPRLVSGHSDLLDLLSGTGLIGSALVAGMVWVMGRGAVRGVAACSHRAQLCAAAVLIACVAALGTVVYSRDIMLAASAGTLLLLEKPPRLFSAAAH